jgi:flagellar biosynthesis/type III secretory pathway chaperone
LKTAKERLSALDDLPAAELCGRAAGTLDELVTVMNQETTLLRAGRMREAGALTADKTRLAQDYVTFARSVQRQIGRLKLEAPAEVERLRTGHERLATQMADNLRVIATARSITEDLLTDVAATVGRAAHTKTYGASGQVDASSANSARGIAVNRAL